MLIQRYSPEALEDWNAFVAHSKNGTFLLNRAYMDYHSDRFVDHSLMIRNPKGQLIALLPANARDAELHSHGGLTYGGLISDSAMTTPTMLAVFDALVAYLREQGFSRLIYKTIPAIYHRFPAEEDRYALFRHDAKMVRRDVLAVIVSASRVPMQKRRERKVTQARKLGLSIETTNEFGEFWTIVTDNLQAVHGVRPVHTIGEIQLLHGRFPENIRLHVCKEGQTVVAGVVVFDTPQVAHVQYISASPRGREIGALDLLFATLIEQDYCARPYFDFGISNEQDGRVLNAGLIEQKEGFGARAVVHDYYRLDLA